MTQSMSSPTGTKSHSCCTPALKKPGSMAFGVFCVPLRLALGGLFLLAAYNKLFIQNGPQLFLESINAFKVFNPKSDAGLMQLATAVTPWIELVAGIALVIGLWTRAAAGVLGLLLIGFIGLIASALMRNLNVSCGCFGKLSPFCSEKIGMCNIVQNSIMLAAAVLIIMCRRHVLAVDALCGGGKKAKGGCCGGKC